MACVLPNNVNESPTESSHTLDWNKFKSADLVIPKEEITLNSQYGRTAFQDHSREVARIDYNGLFHAVEPAQGDTIGINGVWADASEFSAVKLTRRDEVGVNGKWYTYYGKSSGYDLMYKGQRL
jgi:hypothetical protein